MSDIRRPQFHFTPPAGWMNDPNGLVYYQGEYHLFYQHYPHATHWASMHWGHAVSPDLVHWSHLPIALHPASIGAIFSGSVVLDHADTSGLMPRSGLVAIFSYHNQSQGIASSHDNGRTWAMYPGNPVIPSPGGDFRDPKVFWHAPLNHWVMVIAAHDRIKFFTSLNLIEWRFSSEFGEGVGAHGGVWECPDLFPMTLNGDTVWVLLVSVDKGAYAGGSGTQYFLGQFDGWRFECIPQPYPLWLDYGADNYAGVTWNNAPDNRRVLIGWMNNWQYGREIPASTWRGMMTFPRDLALRDVSGLGVRLTQTPIAELASLRGQGWTWRDETINGESNLLAGVRGTVLDIIAEFEAGTASKFGFCVRQGEGEQTIVAYDVANETLVVDRTQSGRTDFHAAFPSVQRAPLPLIDRRVKLHILVDWSSVEVFGGDGVCTLSTLIFPSNDSDGLSVYALGGEAKLVSLELYPLTSGWS